MQAEQIAMPALKEQQTATEIFGNRLRELSDSLGSSYSQVARDLEINRQQFARYLNGSARPRDALVRKMANYFNVDAEVFFQSRALTAPPDQVVQDGTAQALLDTMSLSNTEDITPAELRDGFYMQYRQSFTKPEMVACLLYRVSRNNQGVPQSKRRYSARVAKEVPGIRTSHGTYGMFAKNLGALIHVEVDTVAGDIMMTSFKPASIYSVADRVLTGIMMTHGRPSGVGPTAGRSILERVPEDESILSWARQQGFKDIGDLPDYVQYFLAPPPEDRFPGLLQLR